MPTATNSGNHSRPSPSLRPGRRAHHACSAREKGETQSPPPFPFPSVTHAATTRPGHLRSLSLSLSLSLHAHPTCRPRRCGRRRRACAASSTPTSPPPRTSPPRPPSPSCCAASAPSSRPRSAASRRSSRPPPRHGSTAPPRPAPTSAASAHQAEPSAPTRMGSRRCGPLGSRRSCGRSNGSTPFDSTPLEALVGNLEDAAFSIVRKASKLSLSSILRKSNETEWKQAQLLNAVNAVRDIERELVRISTSRPQWTSLIMAVDSRVDKTLAILRPQALTDYRALLAALGWPPSLSSPDSEKDKYSQIPNPLVLMNEENREKYSQSFLALCSLQHVQANREVRQCQTAPAPRALADAKYSDRTASACFDNGLWAIDELVHPIASRMEYHFAKWSEQPEFIFTLVYKITKDFMDGVDDILQPLIDQARLVGLSAKESWVTGMVKMLVGYLERQIFPALVTSYQDQASVGETEVHSSWMHLNDLMISFDKRMQLLADSGIQKIISISEGLSRSLSVFSIYGEHSEWLQIWAGVELSSAQDKLKSEMEDETSWSYSDSQHDQLAHQEYSMKFLLSTREDYKAPPISEFVVKTTLSMIERGRALPNRRMQIQYNRSSSVKFLNDFSLVLRDRCEALQLSNTALDDQSLSKASCAINAARYCENVLREWDEDTAFLDTDAQGSLFTDEINFLVKLGTEYLEQILSSILLEFEDLSWEYVQNIASWSGQTVLDDQILDEENVGVSPGFVASLDVLTDRTTKLKLHLNSKDFLDLWRSIAEGLDYFIYSSIRWSEVNFSDTGVIQLRVDTKALLHIFRPFCSRPEAFLPFLSESLRLLTMKKSDAQSLLEMLTDDTKSDSRLKHQGLHHVNASQAVKILRSRVFGG